jgi:hypothetical protein
MRYRLFASILALSASLFGNPAAASDTLAVPDLDPAEWFDGKMGGTFGDKTVTVLPKNRRVAVLGFRVVFVTHNEAHAISRASYLPGRDTGSARAKMIVDLQGVDDATLQAITDEVYRGFIQQIKATGREVLTGADFANAYADFKLSAGVPQEVSKGNLKGKAFAPSGQPLWWQVGDAWGDSGLGQTNMRAFNELALKTGAIAIAPAIEVDFAQMQSSGNRSALFQRSAEVGASLAMSVRAFDTRVVRTEENRYGGIVFKGDDGALRLTKRIDTDLVFADLEQGGEEESGGVLSLFGALGSNSKKAARIARTNNDAYRKVATTVLSQATHTFAKLFTAHPVAQ